MNLFPAFVIIFRSRKKFSTTYAIVLFFCFFFSRPFHENFKFLKNCPYDFHEFLHSHSTLEGAPACAKASKSYGWDVRNLAKISPKLAKKQPYFHFFFDFLTNCLYDSNESESEGKRLKPTPLPHMRLWLFSRIFPPYFKPF